MMDQTIQSIVDWVMVVGPVGVYMIITGIAYLENVIPPMPGDVILAFGGYLAAEGLIGVFPLWVLTVAASVVGFMNMYWLGHKLENQIKQNRHEHFVLKFFNYNYIRTGKMWMNRYGQWVVFGNRFLAGTRSVISLTAGMSQLNITRTLVNAAISSALWNAILVGAGWFVRDNWPIIGNYLASYGKGILLLIIAAGLGRYLWLKMAPKK